MRREMTEQIEELRLKGLGYKSIALVVGTSRENVRYYCKTHDLSGDPKEVQAKLADAKKNKNKPERCKNCGKRLVRNSHSGKKLFCGDACRRAWWKNHQEESRRGAGAFYVFECAYCGKRFTSYGNQYRKYCCHNCYKEDRFWSQPQAHIGKYDQKRGMIKVSLGFRRSIDFM